MGQAKATKSSSQAFPATNCMALKNETRINNK